MEDGRTLENKEPESRTETVDDLISHIRSDSDFRDLNSVATEVGIEIDLKTTISDILK